MKPSKMAGFVQQCVPPSVPPRLARFCCHVAWRGLNMCVFFLSSKNCVFARMAGTEHTSQAAKYRYQILSSLYLSVYIFKVQPLMAALALLGGLQPGPS